MSKTLENLSKAFAGESQARNRYTMYSKVAKTEGYEQIAAIFLETADQEREHAVKLFGYINEIKEGNSVVNVETSVPNVYSSTIENLKASIAGRNRRVYKYVSRVCKSCRRRRICQNSWKIKDDCSSRRAS